MTSTERGLLQIPHIKYNAFIKIVHRTASSVNDVATLANTQLIMVLKCMNLNV